MKFFIDNNLALGLARGMEEFGEDVTHLQDRFPDGSKDVEWLPVIGQEGLILVTRDAAIRRRPAELEALRQHRVGAFILAGKNLDRCRLIQQLVRSWPRIKELASKTPPR